MGRPRRYQSVFVPPFFRSFNQGDAVLTPNQQAVLKADILGDSAFTTLKNSPDGRFAIAAEYNKLPAQDWWVWRTYLGKADAVNSTSVDGTTFTWAGNGFISRTVQELMTWENLWNASGSVNPSLTNVRAAFVAIFTGGGNAAANITHLATMARRRATRGEKLFSTGSGSTASPATMGAGASDLTVTFADVDAALNLP